MIMARNEDGTYSQVGFVKDNAGIDTEYIYDKDGDIVFEKGFTRETSGTVPLTINGIEKDLKAWSITGNTVQNGTPTPDAPVDVQGVGDYDEETGLCKIPVVTRGKNLLNRNSVSPVMWGTKFDYLLKLLNSLDVGKYVFSANIKLTLRKDISDSSVYGVMFIDTYSTLNKRIKWGSSDVGTIKQFNFGFTIKETNKGKFENVYLYGCGINGIGMTGTADFFDIQLEAGDSTTPYEPYHAPITTPIYLPTPLYSGEVLRSDGSREVKFHKLVLTGSEDWKLQSINSYGIANFYIYTNPTFKPDGKYFCTHFSAQNTLITQTTNAGVFISVSNLIYIRVKQELANTVSSLKSWLTEQYAAGTPVTIWYTLETPTTETFTAPPIPTLNGTTVIDVDTAVKPTEMYTKYKSSK